MPGLPANNPARVQRDVSIAQKFISGQTYNEIAKATGVSAATVCRTLQREDIKDIIETGTQQAVALVPKAIDNFIDDMYQTPGADNTLRTIRQKASDRILQITGIAPSNVTNQTIINTFNQQNNLVLDETVARALFGDKDEDIIDLQLEGPENLDGIE